MVITIHPKLYMAKRKSKHRNKGSQKTRIPPERFMREKTRALPIGKCYITPDWKKSGSALVIVTRIRPSGNLVMGVFLVDTFCVGVKDAHYRENIPELEFGEYIEKYKNGPGLEEISYNEAHNIIYGAIAFAEEGGVRPSKEFGIAGYVLEEDTDEVPLIEYEFGKNGRHFLVINSAWREMHYLRTLEKTLGGDFEYVMEDGDWGNDGISPADRFDKKFMELVLKGLEKMKAESARYPREEYSYHYPEYPATASVKNQFIADELLSKDNYNDLPRDVIDRILALPSDEAAQDISNIVLYVIGRTYSAINDGTVEELKEEAIIHSLLLLTQLKSEKGLDAVLEIMRQNVWFAEYHLGDMAPELMHPALYACGQNKIAAIEDYLYQPGLESYFRSAAPDALAMIIVNQPERRSEIINVFRRLLVSMESRLPRREACDGAFAGFLMGCLIDVKATELIPEIKSVFETGCVDKSIAGDCESVIKDIENGKGAIRRNKYSIPNIYSQYDGLRRLMELACEEFPGLFDDRKC